MNIFFEMVLGGRVRVGWILAALSLGIGSPSLAQALDLRNGDRVILLGDGFIENERHQGWIEAMLTARFPDREVVFRNLGWSGDTPAGASRLGLSQFRAGREPPDEGRKELVRQLTEARPTVVLIGYGMASSFAGEAGLAAFEADYLRLLDAIGQLDRDLRCVLIGPAAHEKLGPPWPDPGAHNALLRRYDDTVRAIAARRGYPFVSLFAAMTDRSVRAEAPALSENGIHLNDAGYRYAAEVIEEALFGGPGAWRTSPHTEPLRRAIVRKNEWFYHRWRPNNFVYSFGFLKGHQGQDFRDEIEAFDQYVAAEEARIAQLRTLEGIDVPEIPLRTTRELEAVWKREPTATTPYGLVVPREGSAAAEQTKPTFEVAEGLEVALWAQNPLLRNPIHMNFDPDGRLWVATSEVYPHRAPGQTAADKIIVLEDTQGRGYADKATVFADNLLIPTSVEPGDGGAYVTQGAELLHLRDTDGDGRADVRSVVLQGFGVEDGHHAVHGLRWGKDGRLYFQQGLYARSHLETPHGVVRLTAGGVFGLDPRDQRLEVRYRGWINSWGHQFDLYGESFLTDGAGHAGINWGMPGASYITAIPSRRILQSVSAGVYPKFIGIEIIRSRHFPEEWQGDVITCDFRAHTVVRFKMGEQGSAYATREMPPILRSVDQHFRPLDVKLGPDGALYLADWSNPIIQHSGVDFREPRRDREHGRIWRISAQGRAPLARIRWSDRTSRELLDALTSPNNYDRTQARRVLIERGADHVSGDLAAWRRSHPDEESQLQAMWLYQAFNRPDASLVPQLSEATDGRIRAAAVRALPADTPLELLAARVADEHPRVRLEAVRALGQAGSARALELALSVLERPMDPFLDYALWLTVNELATPWLAAVEAGRWPVAGREKQLEFVLAAVEPAVAGEVLGQLMGARPIPETHSWIEFIGRAGKTEELNRLYEQVLRGGFSETGTARALAALSEATRLRNAMPAGSRRELGRLFTSGNNPIRQAALQLAGEWQAGELTTELLRLAGEERTAEPERQAALAALRAIGGPSVIAGLTQLARTAPSPRVRQEAVVAFAGLDLTAALPDVLAVLQATRDPEEAQALWRSLLSIRDAGAKIAAALAATNLPPEVARAGLRPAREGHRHPALVDVLTKSAGLAITRKLSAAELRALAQEAVAKGDASRGEHIYRRSELACMACHAIGGAGGKVGPDLTSIGTSAPPDYLLESLLEPDAQIKQGYHAVLVETKDGRQFSGTLAQESEQEITLRDAAGGEVTVALKDVAQRTNVGSLMPAGLIDSLLDEERADLVKFLSMLGRPGEYDAAQGGVARLWRLYAIVERLQLIPLENIVSGDFTLEDWKPVYSLTNGTLSAELIEAALPARGVSLRGLFVATQFHSAQGGLATFELTAEARSLWVNGQPVKPGRRFTAETQPGTNVLVVQLFESDRARLPAAMKLTSSDVSFLSD